MFHGPPQPTQMKATWEQFLEQHPENMCIYHFELSKLPSTTQHCTLRLVLL